MNASIATRCDLGQYYTSPLLGDLLLSLMSPNKPGVVLDLGVGDGALSAAAYRRWGAIDLVTVDIDRCSQTRLPFRIPPAVRHRHVLTDVLAVDLPSRLELQAGSVGASLCNPPYRNLKTRPSFRLILEDAGLGLAVRKSEDIAADLVFLAQNLRLVKSGGQIGMIVPDSIVAGERLESLRRVLVSEHSIECVLKLPSGSFVGTEAKAHLLVLSKHGTPKSQIRLHTLSADGLPSRPVLVTPSQAITTLDYDYHAFRSSTAHRAIQILRDTDANIVRGSISSVDAKKRAGVLHLTNIKKLHIGHRLYLPESVGAWKNEKPVRHEVVRACPGDILIARVGRRLEQNIFFVETGTMVITDCIYRIRVSDRWRDEVFCSLLAPEGQAFMRSITHGAGAQYVCKRDLETLPLTLRRDAND